MTRIRLWVPGQATRASLTQHQARANNLADVSAKDGSQETLVNLSALLFSFILIPLVSDNQTQIWLLFFLLSAFHIFANYRAARAVRMETLNLARLDILMHGTARAGGYLATKQILSVGEVNRSEPLLSKFLPTWATGRRWVPPVKIGASMRHASQVASLTVGRDDTDHYRFFYRKNTLHVCLAAGTDTRGQIEAAFLANLLARDIAARPRRVIDPSALTRIGRVRDALFDEFYDALRDNGWNLNYVLFDTDLWRFCRARMAREY